MNSPSATLLTLSERAQEKVRELLQETGEPDLSLRVFVTGGGCSGFQYGFTFDSDSEEDDTLIEEKGVRVLVDSLSYSYLEGAVLDYQEGLDGAKFSVVNPSASSTCGCGSSFSI